MLLCSPIATSDVVGMLTVSQGTTCALRRVQCTLQPRFAPQQLGQEPEVGYWPAGFRFRSVLCRFLETRMDDGKLLRSE